MKVYGIVGGHRPLEVGDVVEILTFEGSPVQAAVPLDFSEQFTIVLPMHEPADA